MLIKLGKCNSNEFIIALLIFSFALTFRAPDISASSLILFTPFN
jgi:hypothetical protein